MGAAVSLAAEVDATGAVADSLAAVVTTGSGATGSRPQATDTAAAKRKESPTTFNPPSTLFMEYPFQPIDFVLISRDCITAATCAMSAVPTPLVLSPRSAPHPNPSPGGRGAFWAYSLLLSPCRRGAGGEGELPAHLTDPARSS